MWEGPERPNCIVFERASTGGRVGNAGCVAKERLKTDCRVAVARCVARQCIKTVGRVVGAACVAKERTVPLGGVLPRITAVRCWTYGPSHWQKRKPRQHDRKRADKKAVPQRRPAN